MSNTFLFTFQGILGLILFLFFYWRRLKEDYESEVLFRSGFIIFGGLLVAGFGIDFLVKEILASNVIFNAKEVWYWGGLTGAMIGLGLSAIKYKMKLLEVFEASGLGLMVIYFVIVMFGGLYLMGLLIVVLIIVFYVLETKYRKFTWYKSGRVGFSGLVVLGIYHLVRAGVALKFPVMLSFVGRLDSVVSAALAFLLFFIVYNLSEK